MMQKSIMAIFLASLSVFHSASAMEGVVLWNNPKCGLSVVAVDGGYSFNQQLSAGEINVGDKLDGAFVQEKSSNYANITTGKNVMMWIGRYSTSKKIILDRVPPSCHTEAFAKLN